MNTNSLPNTTVTINNSVYLYFSGTSYLGISFNDLFKKQLAKSIEKWGASYGSSRNANISLNVYEKVEQYLSAFLQLETSLTVSSGTLAGLFALNTLEEESDAFFHMPKTHPSILPNNSCPVFIDGKLNPKLLSNTHKNITIVSDAIAALETEPYNFVFLEEISKKITIRLLIDESHSIGVLGVDGSGITINLPKNRNITLIKVASLGKAFGIPGGIISGPLSFINTLKENPLFIGSAGMSPAFLDCFLNASEIYRFQRHKLQNNMAYIYSKLHNFPNIAISKSYPVFFINDEDISEFLLSEKIVITDFYYPTSPKKINRIVINANHSKKELDILIDAIKERI